MKNAWGEVPWPRNLRLAVQNGSQNLISDAHFTYFPVWENCILESIKKPLAMKVKTAESCVETSDEDDLSSDDLSGIVAEACLAQHVCGFTQ